MLDSGGTSGGTNWWALQIPQMWSMIEHHDPGTHQQVLGAWKRSYELLVQHLSGVERYRASLAAAWPPEKSPAAAAYLERLDILIASLRDTYDAAVDNHRTLAGATSALDSARRTMEGIQREHAGNEALLAGFQEEMRAYQSTPSKGKGVPPQSPIAEGRQRELEEQARRVMSSLSSELALAQISIIQPKPYRFTPKLDESSPFDPGAVGQTLPLSSPAPSLISHPRGSRSNAPPPGRAGREKPIPGEIGRSTSIPSKEYPGPILGEVTPARNPTESSRSFNSPSSSPSNTPEFRPGAISPRPSRQVPGHPGTHAPSGSFGSRGHSTPLPSRQQAIPPGGVIGSPIGGRPTPPSMSTPRTRSVHPIGGILGQSPPSSPVTASRSSRNKADGTNILSENEQRDPDHLWEVDRGIAPVIKPPPEQRIDPGPALGRQQS